MAHNVTMVTQYLETSRRSHATEHQRYLQMVKNIFISRPKYVLTLMNILPPHVARVKWETWELRKAFCGTFSKWTVSFQFVSVRL